ncbi:MAG: F0F1 ATP synthase subunit gamma [Rhodospirillales bacterium]|nr:F0F1 ATP synthase subunit gamma [Rhodospirillales bacterium]MDH3913475.1 F0F1 ATP synthase subunit gamma [Rhodospirillales bacterium]MDH3966976.1 F0F1 ATP synthase subunit gamma [Rhodospirillales bacterium]
MEQLPRLQARISSLHELRDLFRALRALAASHVQEAQSALAGIRRYVEVVEDAIAEGAALLPETDGLGFSSEPSDARVLIVVCSEHGFAGAFNERLLDRAAAERKAGQKLMIIGRRGTILAAERGLDVDRSFPMATRVGGVLAVTRQVAEYLAAISAADVVFGSYRRGGSFETEARSILPLDPALLVGSERRSPPLHHLTPDALLQRLASEYLFAEITRAVTESLASENGARLRVMETADHSIGDKLEDLRRRENVLRQEAITSELLDVVTGSEAILTADGRP